MTEWHKWDDENPPPRGSYLVTLSVNGGKPYVISYHFEPECKHPFACFFAGTKILAWAELPEPFRPSNGSS